MSDKNSYSAMICVHTQYTNGYMFFIPMKTVILQHVTYIQIKSEIIIVDSKKKRKQTAATVSIARTYVKVIYEIIWQIRTSNYFFLFMFIFISLYIVGIVGEQEILYVRGSEERPEIIYAHTVFCSRRKIYGNEINQNIVHLKVNFNI